MKKLVLMLSIFLIGCGNVKVDTILPTRVIEITIHKDGFSTYTAESRGPGTGMLYETYEFEDWSGKFKIGDTIKLCK